MTRMSPAARARRKAKRHHAALIRRIAIQSLKQQGYSCAGCEHFAKTMGYVHCSLRSDYYGYSITTKDDLCLDWENKNHASVS